jgi:hypothetical protein
MNYWLTLGLNLCRIMRTIVFILIISCFTGSAFAQNTVDSDTDVMYDPVFWKQDLRLSKEQYFAINEINSEFYTNLLQAAHQVAATGEPLPSTLLNQRKDLIWDLLSARQKSKWKKISKSFN